MPRSLLTGVALVCAALSASPIFATPAPAQDIQPASVRRDEPFHTKSILVANGHLTQKWQPVERAIEDELATVSGCSQAENKCSADGAKKFRQILDEASHYEGRARLAQLNRTVNLAIKYETDTRNHGIPDHWATPFDTFASGKGDCEDYAIAKYALLRAMHWPEKDLRIVLVYIERKRQYHAVEAARLGHDWIILDNGRLTISNDASVLNYHPLFTVDQSGVRKLEHASKADASKIKSWNTLD